MTISQFISWCVAAITFGTVIMYGCIGETINQKAGDLNLGVPGVMMIGGIGLMWYNNARFGSPFDFGASYQLTVSDIHANKIHAAGFMPMLYHYIFQYPRPRCTFPFFEPQFYYLGNYGSYAYIADAVGALSFPLVLLKHRLSIWSLTTLPLA